MPNFKKVNKMSADGWKLDAPYAGNPVAVAAGKFISKIKDFVVPMTKAAAPKFYSKKKK